MYQIENASSLYWTNAGHPINQILSKKHFLNFSKKYLTLYKKKNNFSSTFEETGS